MHLTMCKKSMFIILSVFVIHSHEKLFGNVRNFVKSSFDDKLSEFITTLNSLPFEKIGSDFTSDVNDLLRYNLGLSNEDRNLNGYQLLHKNGYNDEVYTVQTNDGYILELVRIPGKGAVVLIVHGLLSSWEDFVTSGPDFGLAYLLAFGGYDVWLLNCRGNKFSRNHVTLSPDEIEFWNFSWHEIGTRDIPAAVERILSITGKKKIIYIGHSQGTTAGFVWLSEYPEYNSVVTVMICLSPIGYMNHAKSPLLRALTPFRNEEYFILNALGQGELMPRDGFIKIAKKLVCSTTVMANFICNSVLFLFCGFDYDQLNYTNFVVEYAHIPSGTSAKEAIHYLQEVASGRFRQFDYGKQKNLEVYKSEEPPDYNLSNIVAPVAFYYAKNDWLADTIDVERLSKEIPNLVEMYLVPFDKFNHVDFLWAKDVVPLLYKRIFELLLKYSDNDNSN